jgi:hypothetical protein
MSSSLLEVYGGSLLKAGDTASGIINLRKAGGMRLKENGWWQAFVDYKKVFDVSRAFLDGNKMVYAIFKYGVETNDSSKIQYANQLWDFFIKKSISYKCSVDITVQIIDTRIQAYNEAKSFKVSKRISSFFYKVIVEKISIYPEFF